MRIFKNNQGAVALTAVILVSGITLGLALTVGLLSVSDLQIVYHNRLDELASGAADSCFEEGIFRLKREDAFTSASITVDADTSCTVTISGSGGSRTFVSTGTYQNSTVTWTGTFTISETGSADGRWVEVSDLVRE